jgi:hypothetical protein
VCRNGAVFTPTRNIQDLWEEDDDNAPFEYAEVKLAVPVETFLNYSWGWADLCAFASGEAKPKIMWITDDEILTVGAVDSNVVKLLNKGCPGRPSVAGLTSKNDQQQTLTLFERADVHHLSMEGRVVFWRAITTSNCVKLRMQDWVATASIIAQFLEESPSLQVLQLEGIHFREDHCRALATVQRTGLEVKFHRCTLKPQNAKHIFNEWLRHSQIVTELTCCFMESSLLSALSGNNSVKKLLISKHTSEQKNIQANITRRRYFRCCRHSQATWVLRI